MKDDKTFNEELFRDAFSDFSPEPPKDMLDKIQQSRSRSNTSSSKKKWIAGATALIIISAVGVSNYNPAPIPETVNKPTEILIEAAEDSPETPIIEEIHLIDKEKTIVEPSKTIIIEKTDTIFKTLIIETPDVPEEPDFG